MEIHEFSTIGKSFSVYSVLANACGFSDFLLCLASLDVGESLSASLGVDFNDTTNPAKFDIR